MIADEQVFDTSLKGFEPTANCFANHIDKNGKQGFDAQYAAVCAEYPEAIKDLSASLGRKFKELVKAKVNSR